MTDIVLEEPLPRYPANRPTQSYLEEDGSTLWSWLTTTDAPASVRACISSMRRKIFDEVTGSRPAEGSS